MKIAKSVLSVILALSVVIGVFGCYSLYSAAEDTVIPGRAGDANSDGAVNALDALFVIRYCTDQCVLTDDEKLRADVDGDKQITSTDALYILHFSVGKIKHFTVQPNPDLAKIEIFGYEFYYDKATGIVTNDDGSGLLGFAYDANARCFYAAHNSWQRNFGYTYIYDYAAPFAVIWYDTSRIFFNYDNKEWMVQLWKGQYGWVLVGCEIGLYYRDFDDEDYLVDNKGRKYFKCAEDEMLIQISLTLYRGEQQLFTRREQYSWWLTGFVPGALNNFGFEFDDPKELSITSQLTFQNEEIMNAFIDGLKKCTEVEHNATKKIRKIEFKESKTKAGSNGYHVNPATNTVTLAWN